MHIDKLKNFIFQEKSPLALLMLSQAYVIFLWLTGWNVYSYPAITVSFAAITAVSIDSVVVSTTFSKYRNNWSLLTSVVAMLSGVAIALDLFYRWEWNWLHASFPILIFFYSNHASAAKALQSEGTSQDSEGKYFNIDDLIDRLIGEELSNEGIYRIVRGKKQTTIDLIKERRGLKEVNETEK